MSPFDRQDLRDSNNQFALDLYARLSQGHSSNLFFSPFSISTALSMTLSGARGKTEREMAKVLHLPSGNQAVHSEYGSLIQLILGGEVHGCELSVANRLWGQSGYDFRPKFLELLRRYYAAQPETLDFVGQPEPSRRRINQWVEEQTKGRIPELVSRGAIAELTRMILTNAIYFKGDWATRFDKSDTQDAPFHRSLFKKAQVKMMQQQDAFSYAKVKGIQILELPYGKEELSMVVLLPRQVGNLQKLERQLTSANLHLWLSELRIHEVLVYLPRFRLSTEYPMSTVLQSLGMVGAFSPEAAEFSGMSETKPGLFISEVIHKAFMETNEEGSEAAAATALVQTLGASLSEISMPKIVEFRADHPFVFLICHRPSGTILFMGRITDPNET